MYGQGQGQWSYHRGLVSDDVIGKDKVRVWVFVIRHDDVKGKGMKITRNRGCPCGSTRDGVRGMSLMRQCEANEG